MEPARRDVWRPNRPFPYPMQPEDLPRASARRFPQLQIIDRRAVLPPIAQTKGRNVTLVGDLQGELARLSGAEVRVHGLQREKSSVGGFDVKRYDILEVDGEVPRVGTLRARDGILWLDGHDTVEVLAPPVDLRARDGAKVWIVGYPAGERLAVQSYGILREAGR